jgi:hypothetical protein
MMAGENNTEASKIHVKKYPNHTMLNVTATGQQRKYYLNIIITKMCVNPQTATGLNVLSEPRPLFVFIDS